VRVAEHRESLGLLSPPPAPASRPGEDGVVVHLVPATGTADGTI
jgi:hypothetical protein